MNFKNVVASLNLDKGFVFYRYNPSEAVDIYNAFVYSLIPFSAIFALIVVGLAVRLFFSRTSKYNTEDERNVSWKFVTSPFLAYSYLVLLGFSLIPSSGIFAASISFAASIFMAVYFYIGICALYSFISHKKNGRFAVLIILLSMLFFSSYAPKIISFIGVFVNNAFYKAMNSERDDI